MIQTQDQSDPIKFEVHMYHPTAMANAVTPTSWFYTLYVLTPSSITQRDNTSRLEIAFLLDSAASIAVSVPFAVADVKYNILGTLEFKYQSKTHPNYAKFTTLLFKDYPYFSYIYRMNSKTRVRSKPKSSKIALFPLKN